MAVNWTLLNRDGYEALQDDLRQESDRHRIALAADFAEDLYRRGYGWGHIIEQLRENHPCVTWGDVQSELSRRQGPREEAAPHGF